MAIESAFEKIKVLIQDFKNGESHFLSANYSEAEVRKDFIDKFFKALGWDVDHKYQKNPFQQEVKVEKAQKQEGYQSQKRADYAFALAPDFKRTQFFVEAKKPSRLLRQNKDDYFQTAKYGWNSQTGISILTDFQEFVIIDCRFKPDFDTILKNEIKYYNYEEFADEDKFSEIYWLFSREALLAGNLAEYVEHLPKAKSKEKQLKLFGGKYLSIDESFLNYIDDIRLQMAQAFHYNNLNLDHYDLTEATQRTIDRLVFIRFLEDKQIEPEDLMHSISTANFPWQKFIEISKRLDAKYNGVVFKEHFIDKKDFLGADEELFRAICADLDHTNTPYDFNYIPIHILGNIYERFLGKIITIDNGKANIELKPEVRKAGGVFYTPKYIVDYIVENTVGKLIADKKPTAISQLTFADIACGSGSFLIGVFDYLLDYHKNYYNQNPDEAKKAGCKYDAENGVYVLTIKQKQQILLNNVFGVDIDLQATEVTQVSLFLKLLEDETMGTVAELNQLFIADKILPDLSGNIKCGNSLIGTEIMFDVLDFSRDDMRKLNPFDFETAFPKVFRKGGFDAIVGNPPYGADLHYYEYLVKKYPYSSQTKTLNSYLFFCEKPTLLLKENGLLGYIIPDTFLLKTQYENFRNFILTKVKVEQIIETGAVFEQAKSTPNVILIYKNIPSKKNDVFFRAIVDYQNSISKILNDIFKKLWVDSGYTKIQEVLDSYSHQLGKYINFDRNNLIQKIKSSSLKISEHQNIKIDRGIEGGKASINNNLGKYNILIPENIDSYVTDEFTDKTTNEFKESFNYDRILVIRIRSLKIKRRIIASFENQKRATLKTLQQIYNLFDNKELYFILGNLNSKVMNFYCSNFLVDDINKDYLMQLPIPKITTENQQLHDDLVKLVEQMLKAKKEEQNAKTDQEKNLYKNLTESLDFKINNLVYQLYNLTEEEISLVEKNS